MRGVVGSVGVLGVVVVVWTCLTRGHIFWCRTIWGGGAGWGRGGVDEWGGRVGVGGVGEGIVGLVREV